MVTKVLGTCRFQLHTKMEASSSRQLASTVLPTKRQCQMRAHNLKYHHREIMPRIKKKKKKTSCRFCGKTFIYELHRLHVYLSQFIVTAIKRKVKYTSAVLLFYIQQKNSLNKYRLFFRYQKTTQIPRTLFSEALVSLLPGTFAKPSRLYC